MRFIILIALLSFPVAEGALLFRLAEAPGHGAWVIAWLFFAAFAGVMLIKQARFELLARLAYALRDGHFSLAALIDSFRTVLAGLLLIFPGIISDVMALGLLLLPLGDRVLQPAYPQATARGSAKRDPRIIDGDFRREL